MNTCAWFTPARTGNSYLRVIGRYRFALWGDKANTAITREQRLLAGSAERSNFNEVNGQRTTDKTCAHEPQDKNSFQFTIHNSQLAIDCCQLPGMLNIGYRPTLNNGKERSIEVHILDFEGDLYGKDITVEFAHRLREERTYANTEELTEQLMRDEKKVRELLVAEE